MPTNREIKRLRRLEMIKKRADEKAAAEQAAKEKALVAPLAVADPGDAELPVEAPVLPKLKFQPAGTADGVAGARMARIYARPINVRMRLIEFEDRSHGKLWVPLGSDPMLNWKVWVVPHPDKAGDWVIHGRYNARGTRLQ